LAYFGLFVETTRSYANVSRYAWIVEILLYYVDIRILRTVMKQMRSERNGGSEEDDGEV
jgi:hypothetical protein